MDTFAFTTDKFWCVRVCMKKMESSLEFTATLAKFHLPGKS